MTLKFLMSVRLMISYFIKKPLVQQVWWNMTIIPATKKAEARGS
jgi:hypothetical protein